MREVALMADVFVAFVGVAGFGLVVSGLFMAWPPLGWVAAGALLVLVALALDKDEVEA